MTEPLHRGDIDKGLGACLIKARKAAKMTQVELGETFGRVQDEDPTPQTTISRWEGGHVTLDIAQILGLDAALGRPPGTLLIEAGLIRPDMGDKLVETALLTDPALDASVRDAVVVVYRAAVEMTNAKATEPVTEEAILNDRHLDPADAQTLAALYRSLRRGK